MKDKRLVNTIVGLLVIQFILGILANLYATIPQQKPYEVFHQFGYILFHALNGTLLVVLGVVFAAKRHRQNDFRLAISGLVSLLLAFAFGEFFVFTRNNVFSLLMAVAFIGALMPYARIAFSNPTK